MIKFESILQECLHDLEGGAVSIEECLQRYPQYAGQLEPVLLASVYIARGREAKLSPAFKARVRTRLLQQMYASPRKAVPVRFPFMRLAAGLVVLLLALLITGTTYAQRALPGESFYGWKLASENVWRAVSPDPVGTDLAIAERRFDELIAVSENSALHAQTLVAYLQVTERLRSQVDSANEARILAVLEAQTEELKGLGILPDESDPILIPPLESPIQTPATAPLPTLRAPEIAATDVPQVLPTVQVVPEIVPTVPKPPRIIPTNEVPLPIP